MFISLGKNWCKITLIKVLLAVFSARFRPFTFIKVSRYFVARGLLVTFDLIPAPELSGTPPASRRQIVGV